jgi:hypothetical protein
VELDLKNLSTFRNHPAPARAAYFDQELARMGGLNPHGEPRLRVVWGQEARIFAYDEYHLKYLAARWIAAKSSHLYRNLTTGETRAITREEAEDTYDKDPDWLYLNQEESESVEVGLPRWIVETWVAPELYGPPATWEQKRCEWGHDERSGMIRKYDVLGPYPSRGNYVEVLTVETKDGLYRPLGQDVLDEIRRRLFLRDQAGPLDLSLEMKRANERESNRATLAETEFVEHIADEILPHAHRLVGNPRISMAGSDVEVQNKVTKHGKTSNKPPVAGKKRSKNSE